MPRLRDIQTGAVVSVSDETAARLGPGWESATKTVAKAPASASRPESAPVVKKATVKRAARRPATKTVAKKAAASKTEK